MKKFKLIFLAVVAVLFLSLGQANAAPEILTTDQLQSGMQGIAKTVIEGTRIDTFAIEIVGVMNASKASDGRIIAKASGAVIDQTGGVLQGMSGSPVYIDGKLIGAVSGGWKDIDNRTCIITPIADMLKLWEMPDRKNQSKIKQVDFMALKSAKESANKVDVKDEDKDKDKVKLADRLAAPLMVSGFGEAGMQMLTEKLAPLQIVPYAVGGSGAFGEPVELEPGSSIGVQIVRGDIDMAAIGTVTAVEDGKVLAFGHPFLRKGNVNYFMTDAQIIATASGTTAGFKIGTPGNVLGRINQDRSAAVAGIIGQYPSVIPVKVTVEDAQLQTKQNYTMQIAYAEELLAPLIPSIVYNAMDASMDRVGAGTAQVAFEIMTNSVPSGKLQRDNMYYNVQDVGQIAVSEIYQAMNLLCTDVVGESDIVSVKVNIKVDELRKTASIVEVTPEQSTAKAGDTVNLCVKLKPYRQAEIVVNIPYTVPKQQSLGMLNLEVRGGGLIPVALLLLQQQGIDLSPQEDKMKPLSLKLDDLVTANRNNELIIAPALVMPEALPAKAMPPKLKMASPPEMGKQEMPSAVEMPVKQATDYIIDNVMPVSIKIVEK